MIERRNIPRGIEARRQHDPIELAKQYDRVAHETVEVSGRQRDVQEFDRKPAPPPESLTVLEDAINTVLERYGATSEYNLARRILLVPRIAKALRLLEDHENGLVDIVYPGKEQQHGSE